ncbi:MAG: MFS transporter [Chloroflexota bacterium]|nr:MFS transporter [Chloroflexota bacterium]|tara:strand:+ start:832 stop:2166 length:1335 start_codon:yes stop_codon:yes gene_type:complete
MVNLNETPTAGRLSSFQHYGWAIVAMATVLQVSTNFISQAFSILIVILKEDFGWSLTAIGLAYFFRSIISAVLSPVAGMIADRHGVRRSMIVAGICYTGGMFLLSTISAQWQLYLYYSVILGIAQSLFRVNIPTTVAAWFKTRLGLAVGIQQSAGGMGGSIMAPALALLLSRTDWETAFWIIPAVGGTIVFSLIFLFHGDPADRNKKPYGATEDDPPPVASSDPAITKLRSKVFLSQAKQTLSFWNLIAIHHLGCVGHSIVMVAAVVYATQVGLTLQAAAWIVSIYSLTSIASRFATPLLADMCGPKWVMSLAYTIQGISVALLFWTQEPWQFYLFAGVFGVGLGGEMSAFLVINRQYYGMGPVRAIFGFQNMGSGVGMAIGGFMGLVIADRYGFDIAWIISIVASLGGAVCILLLQSTARVLIPNWEDALPAEARTPAPAASS